MFIAIVVIMAINRSLEFSLNRRKIQKILIRIETGHIDEIKNN